MKKVLRKSHLTAGILVLVVVCVGIVLAGDVIVKEGTIEAENIDATGTIEGGSITTTGTIRGANFASTVCTAWGLNAIAFGGGSTAASGDYSTAMGYYAVASGFGSRAMGIGTTASGDFSTAMGATIIASGACSTAMGYGTTAGPANYTTAIGTSFANDVQSSFAVGYDGDEDLRVRNDWVKVYGDLDVTGNVDADSYTEHSSFYDKDTYGNALD